MTAIQGLYEFHAAEGRIDDKQFVKLAHGWGKRGGFLRGIVKSGPERRKAQAQRTQSLLWLPE
jgi:hypothetical protein